MFVCLFVISESAHLDATATAWIASRPPYNIIIVADFDVKLRCRIKAKKLELARTLAG